MKKYKPEFLGKVIPADNPSKLTDFVQNKYDSFSRIYEKARDHSEDITDIKTVDTASDNPSSLSVKISTNKETLGKISAGIEPDSSVKMNGDVITATD